jgi:pyrimidine-nucleoside phosphorylase
LLKTPTFKFKIQAMRSGVVEAIDAEKVARVALQLGAGREKAADRIDPLAGVTLEVSVGDRVVVGDPLAILESSTSNKMERLAADLLDAFRIKK